MATANIDIKLSNGQQAGQTINELSQQANRLRKEINNLKPGTDEFVKKSAELNKVGGRLKEVRNEVTSTKEASKGLLSQFQQFIPFSGQLSQVSSAFKAVNLSLKGTRAALIATGIGAFIVVLGSLISYLTSVQSGIDKVTSVTRPLTAVFQTMKGVVQELGGNIFKGLAMILNGDIKEGLKVIGNGFVEVVGNTKEAIKQGIEAGTELDKLQKQIERTENELILKRARLNVEYERSKEIANDQAKTETERINAARRAIAVQNELQKAEGDFLQLKIDKKTLENSLNDTSREDTQALNTLIAEQIQLEAEAARKRKSARAELNALLTSEGLDNETDELDLIKANPEILEGRKAQLDQELDLEQKANDTILGLIRLREATELNSINNVISAKVQARQMAVSTALSEASAVGSAIGGILGNVVGLQEKGSKKYKQFAAAQARLAAIQAALNAYQSTAALPGGAVLAPIAAAAALAFGMKKANEIERAQIGTPGGGSSGGGVSLGNSVNNTASSGGINFNNIAPLAPTNPLTTTTRTPDGTTDNSKTQSSSNDLINELRAMRIEVSKWPTKLEVHNNLQSTKKGIETLNSLETDSQI